MKKYISYVPLIFTLAATALMCLPKGIHMNISVPGSEAIRFFSYFSKTLTQYGKFLPALTALLTIAATVIVTFSAFTMKNRGFSYAFIGAALICSVLTWALKTYHPKTGLSIAITAVLGAALAAAVLFNRKRKIVAATHKQN